MKSSKIFSGLAVLSFLASIMSSMVAPYISIPAMLLVASIANPVQGVVGLDPSSDVSALTNYVGKFDKKLISQMLNSLDIADDIYVMRGLKSDHHLPKFTAENGLRPLNTNVEENSGTERSYSNRTIEMKGGMKVFKIIPEDLRDSFMSEMLEPNAKEIPFSQFVWQKEFEKLASELNDNNYLSDFNADASDYSATATYSSGDFVNFNEDIYEANQATSAGESPTSASAKWDLRNATSTVTGLGTIIADEITASNITAVATGAITSSNAYDKVIEVFRSLPDAVRNSSSAELRCYVSTNTMDKYLDQIETDFGNGNIADLPENKSGWRTVRKTEGKLKIKACSWMGSSSRIIVSPYKNLRMGTNELSDTNKVGKMVQTLHGYKAITKWLWGFQIADLDVIAVNDQA